VFVFQHRAGTVLATVLVVLVILAVGVSAATARSGFHE
jgi:hypothetical protein